MNRLNEPFRQRQIALYRTLSHPIAGYRTLKNAVVTPPAAA